MSNKIPDEISETQIIEAIRELDRGVHHAFSDSTGYDVLFDGHRYPPKAVVGIAAGKITGQDLGPYDFKGGVGSKCFRILEANGFAIVTKPETRPFPEEIDNAEVHVEGAVQRVSVNRYERDRRARAKAIQHHGPRCQVCDFDFEVVYGTIGRSFIHVHHTIPLYEIGKSYVIDPIRHLRPVCPNCHAMIHKRIPPYTIEELRDVIEAAKCDAQRAPAKRIR